MSYAKYPNELIYSQHSYLIKQLKKTNKKCEKINYSGCIQWKQALKLFKPLHNGQTASKTLDILCEKKILLKTKW